MTMIRRFVVLLALGIALGASTASAQSAASAYRQGNTHLAAGDLQQALKSYGQAAQADRANQQYAQQFLLVRRIVQLQGSLDKETNPARWGATAQSLRSFYVSRGLHAQALPVDEAIWQRDKSSNAAIQIAETRLALGQHAQAASLLESLPEDAATPGTQALLSIARARQGQLEQAKATAAAVTADDAGPGTLYLVARMHGAVGDAERAVQTLTHCFQAVPPSRLEDLKAHSRVCLDFAALSSSPAFTSALKTESKVVESRCSGGTSCANCPMRGDCSSGN